MTEPLFLAIYAALGAATGSTVAASAIRDRCDVNDLPLLRLACASTTGALFVMLTAVIGVRPHLPAHLYVAAMAVPLATIDIRTMRLPHRLTVPMYPSIALLLWLADTSADYGSWNRAIAGMALCVAFHLALALTSGGLGGGDVVLSGPTGLILAWHSWTTLLAGTVLAGLFGALTVAWTLLRTGRTPDSIPYGPSLLAGTLTAAVMD